MSKDKITDYSTTASSNSDIGGTGILGTNKPSNFDDGLRTLMKHLAETNAGTYPVADTWSFGDPAGLTKRVRLDAGNVTAGQTRVLTMPDSDVTITTAGAAILDDATAADQRTTLGAAASGANSDITSMSGLTGTLASTISASLNRGFNISQAVTGTVGAVGFNINRIYISADDADGVSGGAGKVDGLQVEHHFGGTSTKGGRHAIEAFAFLDSPTNSANPDRNYVGGAFTGVGNHASGDGGGSGTEQGAIFGINAVGRLDAGVYYANLSGGEINVKAVTGTSVLYKSGLQIVAMDSDAVQGSTYDTALAISNQATAVGFENGILFGAMNGAHPVTSGGTLIATVGSSTVDKGIDWTSYTFTTSIFAAPNVTIRTSYVELSAANHGLEMGALGSANTPYIDFHSSGVDQDYDSRLIAAGGGAGPGLGTLYLQAAAFDMSTGCVLKVSGNQVVGARGTAVGKITTSASTGTLPTPDGTMTFADAASPTVAELLEGYMELEAKVELIIDRIGASAGHGLTAD